MKEKQNKRGGARINSGPKGHGYSRKWKVKTVAVRVPQMLVEDVHLLCNEMLEKNFQHLAK